MRYIQGASINYGVKTLSSRCNRPRSPQPSRDNELEQKTKWEPTRLTLKIIVGEFSGGGKLSSMHKRYVRHVIHFSNSHSKPQSYSALEITFSHGDINKILSLKDNPMVFNVQMFNLDVKQVLKDPRSYVDILYWDSFKPMQLDPWHLNIFRFFLEGFLWK